MKLLLTGLALLLAACATEVQPPAVDLKKPSGRLMVEPAALPDVNPGDDLYLSNVQCRGEYSHETGKLRGLQGYVRTVLKK